MPKMEKADAVEAMLSEMRCALPTVSLQVLIERLRHMHDIRDGSPNAFYAAFDALWKDMGKPQAGTHPSWCVCEECKRAPIGGAATTSASRRDDRTDAQRQADGGW
jgi:hypothetical protein